MLNFILALAAGVWRALQTPTANKAFQALNAWLDKQITPPVENSGN